MVRNCPDSKTWEKVEALLLQKWKRVSFISCLGLPFKDQYTSETNICTFINEATLVFLCLGKHLKRPPPVPNRRPLRHFHLDGSSLVVVDRDLYARSCKIPVKGIHVEEVFVGVRRGISPCDRLRARACFVLIRFKADPVAGVLGHPRNLTNGRPCRPEKRNLRVNIDTSNETFMQTKNWEHKDEVSVHLLVLLQNMKVNVLHGVPAEHQTMFTRGQFGGEEDPESWICFASRDFPLGRIADETLFWHFNGGRQTKGCRWRAEEKWFDV